METKLPDIQNDESGRASEDEASSRVASPPIPQHDAGVNDVQAGEEAWVAFGWLRRLDWSVVWSVMAVKVLLLLFAAQAFQLLADRRIETFYGWLEIWNRWDAPHYLDIAREGYVSTGEHRLWLVFYPLYPWLVRVAAFLTGGDWLLGAFAVSTVASIAAALLLHRLALLDETQDVARRAVWFMLIFPTSYFLHIGYTESLFIALSLGCFWAARKRVWWLAGVLGALAGLSRVNGLVLLAVLAVEAFEQYRETRRIDGRWLWIALAGVGFGGYLLLNQHVSGDWLGFMHMQEENWYRTLTWPWTGVREIINSISWRAPSEALMVGTQELLFTLLGLAGALWCLKKCRLSYGVWMAGNWILWTSSSFVYSVPRYTLIMFPIYIIFARLAAARPLWGQIITLWSLFFLALFVGQFVQGRWAF